LGLGATDVERSEEHPTRGGHVLHSGIERRFIGLRWSVKATDFADELQRRIVQLMICGLAVRLSQTLDVSTHVGALLLVCSRLTDRG